MALAATFRHAPGSGAALLVLALSSGGRTHAIVLESLDLASLHAEADLVVLVEGFRSAGMTQAGTGTVLKVYKGDHSTGADIHIVPWAMDLGRGDALAGGKPPEALTVLFFLRADARGGAWGAVSSGSRALVGGLVHGVVQVGGSGPFVLAPARTESMDSVKASRPYDLAGLEEDMAEARDRVRNIAKELEAPGDRGAPKRCMKLIDEELRRLFERGGAVTRSELVLKLARKVAGAGEIETLWSLRKRVPRERMGRELDEIIADRATLGFILGLLADRESHMAAIDFCAEEGFRIPNGIKRDVVKRIIELTREMPRPLRARGYAAAAAIYRGTEIEPDDPLLPRILDSLKGLEGGALYHMGSALAERQPEVARAVLQGSLRVFGLVTIDDAATSGLSGRVEVRRFPGEQVLGDPVMVLERVLPDGTVLERRREPLGAHETSLCSSKAGTSAAGFRMEFKEPLPGGSWRAFLELHVEERGESRDWRSGATIFDVAD